VPGTYDVLVLVLTIGLGRNDLDVNFGQYVIGEVHVK